MTKRDAVVCLGCLVAFSVGALLSRAADAESGEPSDLATAWRMAVLPRVRTQVRAEVERHAADACAKALEQVRVGERVAAHFKTPLVKASIGDPWVGAVKLERHGLALALAGKGGSQGVPQMLDRMCEAIGKPVGQRGKTIGTPGRTLR